MTGCSQTVLRDRAREADGGVGPLTRESLRAELRAWAQETVVAEVKKETAKLGDQLRPLIEIKREIAKIEDQLQHLVTFTERAQTEGRQLAGGMLKPHEANNWHNVLSQLHSSPPSQFHPLRKVPLTLPNPRSMSGGDHGKSCIIAHKDTDKEREKDNEKNKELAGSPTLPQQPLRDAGLPQQPDQEPPLMPEVSPDLQMQKPTELPGALISPRLSQRPAAFGLLTIKEEAPRACCATKIVGWAEEPDSDATPGSPRRQSCEDPRWSTALRSTLPNEGPGRARLSLQIEMARASLHQRKSDEGVLSTFHPSGMRDLLRPGVWKGISAKKILNSNRFDNIISMLILANAVTIGLEADYVAQNVELLAEQGGDESFESPFRWAELLFCTAFTFELGARLHVHRSSFFCRREWNVLWNYFDFVVVGTQLVQEGISLAASSSLIDVSKFRVLRILRVLRIIRIFRLVRLLHLISELRTIVSSIAGSFKSLVWTVLLLLLMMYIVGVFFTQSITDHMLSRHEEENWVGWTPGEGQLRFYFGSLGRTILSLWQAISGGADWASMADPLMTEVAGFLGLAFAAYIVFALLALMNVVTGVFVQTALHSAAEEEDNFMTDQIVGLFQKGKFDPETMLSKDEVKTKIEDPDTAKEWKSMNVSAAQAEYIFNLVDVDNSGEVLFEEFLGGCLRLHGQAKSLDMLISMQESRKERRALEFKLEELSIQLGRLEWTIDHKTSRQASMEQKLEEIEISFQKMEALGSLVEAFVSRPEATDAESNHNMLIKGLSDEV